MSTGCNLGDLGLGMWGAELGIAAFDCWPQAVSLNPHSDFGNHAPAVPVSYTRHPKSQTHPRKTLLPGHEGQQ